MAEKEAGFFKNLIKTGAEVINDAGAFMGLLRSKLIAAEGKNAIDKIILEEKDNLNANQIRTIYALYETGEIGKNQVGADINRGGKKSSAISDAIDMSKNEPHILVYANEKYNIVSVQKYKNDTDGKPENLNSNIVKGLLRMATETGSSQLYEKYLTRKTLQDLAIYLQGRGYKSRLIPDGIDVKNMMEGLAKEKKDAEKAKIDPLFQSIREKFGKTPEVMNRLELIGKSFGIPISSSGEFQIDSFIKNFFLTKEGIEDNGKDIKELGDKIRLIESGVNKMIKDISTERDVLIKKLGGDKFSMSDSQIFGGNKIIVKDSDGKNIDISKASLLTLSKNQAQDLLSQISVKTNGKELDQQAIDIILFLGLHSRLSNAQGIKAQVKTIQDAINKGELKASIDPTTGKKDIQVDKKLRDQLKVSQLSAETAQNTKDIQSVIGKISPQEAQEKLKKLNPDSQEAANLRQYLGANSEAVKYYRFAVENLGKDDAEKIFTQNYKEVTGDKSIKIDSEKAMQLAILTDPESTLGERAFARLKPGQSISMQSLMEGGEMQGSLVCAPEIASMQVSVNQNGTYNIPLLNENNLTKPQVEEYIINIGRYTDLGLSQFIPHIQLITKELRSKGENIKIDGSISNKEQEMVLKYLYTKLFGEKLETNNLPETEQAFHSKMKLAPNMKNAMQETLENNGLINSPGQAISAERLQNWFNRDSAGGKSNIHTLENML